MRTGFKLGKVYEEKIKKHAGWQFDESRLEKRDWLDTFARL
jgi:hypothetical protein